MHTAAQTQCTMEYDPAPRAFLSRESHQERINFALAFQVVDDNRRSEKGGPGVITQRSLLVGETFVDVSARYKAGAPPSVLDEERCEYIRCGDPDGYFFLMGSTSQCIHEPRDGKEVNVELYIDRISDIGREPFLVLGWRVVHPIVEGGEVLAAYKIHEM